MEDFAVRGQRNSAGFIDGLSNFFSPNLAGATEDQPTMRVDPANMRTGNAQECMFNRDSGAVLGAFTRLLYRRHGSFQIDNDAFARSARVRQPMPAIAQPVLG